MKNKMITSVLLLALVGGAINGCKSTGGVEVIETMTDLEFNKWKLYIELGVKIGANRLLQEQVVTEEELKLAATVMETVRDQSVVPGVANVLTKALEDSGLTNDEIKLLLLIVEQELQARGAFDWVNPETGLIALSPRTKELLTVVADALRSAGTLTHSQVQEGLELEETFQGKIIKQ